LSYCERRHPYSPSREDAAARVSGHRSRSHLAVQADELATTIEVLLARGLEPGPEQRPGRADGARTSWLVDPDGYRIELVQWPAGHADGITAADFA
jgi:lactoylglutathione lyase